LAIINHLQKFLNILNTRSFIFSNKKALTRNRNDHFSNILADREFRGWQLLTYSF